MMPDMKKISILVFAMLFMVIACKIPKSAAYLDNYFTTLLPQGTETIKKQFLHCIILKNENI